MASKFPKFLLLPRAIRLQIWYDALPLFGRIINIRFKKEILPNGKYQYNRAIIHATSPPALLHVNREARKELKRFYSAPFNGPNSRKFELGEMAKYLAFYATSVSAPNPPAFNLGAMATLVSDVERVAELMVSDEPWKKAL
jgi:hypothetical protein